MTGTTSDKRVLESLLDDAVRIRTDSRRTSAL
jgi:hypothetical protein